MFFNSSQSTERSRLHRKSGLHSFSPCWRCKPQSTCPWGEKLIRAMMIHLGTWKVHCKPHWQEGWNGTVQSNWCLGAGKMHGKMRGKRGKEMQPYCWGYSTVTSSWIMQVHWKELNTWGRAWIANPYHNSMWPSGEIHLTSQNGMA